MGTPVIISRAYSRALSEVFRGICGESGRIVAVKRVIMPYEQQTDPVIRKRQEMDGVCCPSIQLFVKLVDPSYRLTRNQNLETNAPSEYC